MTASPIRKTRVVPADQQSAFLRFTRQMHAWWPVATHSICADKVQTVVFEEHTGGRIFERHHDGTEHLWGQVRAWDPHGRVVFSFMEYGEGPATEVEVRFTTVPEGTRVDLEHRGWEAYEPAVRHGYDTGWDQVFGRGFGASFA